MIAIERRRVLVKASTVVSTLSIRGALTMSAETCQYLALVDDTTDVSQSCTWSITQGSQYATISSGGTVTILQGANESSVIIRAEYNNLTANQPVTLTYVSGSSSETSSETVTDDSGNTTIVTTTVTTNEDGSSSEHTESVAKDSGGTVIGTTEIDKDVNTDGSYTSTEINYDANGNPTDGSNASGDTNGNVSTQDVKFDESGGTVVTGYDIDTSGNPEGIKEINGEEVNTEFYAFDTTHAFELMIHFYYDPAKQTVNQATILNAKRRKAVLLGTDLT